MRSRICVALALASLIALSAAPAVLADAHGTDRPFSGIAVGVSHWPGDNPLDCAWGETTHGTVDGTASHLGKVHIETLHCPTFYQGDGVIDIVAANGDVLHGTYVLTLTEYPLDFIGPVKGTISVTFDGTESTGRFAGATGSALIQADLEGLGLEEDNWPLVYTWSGSLSY